MLPHLQRFRRLTLSAEEWSDLLVAAVIGVIVGGRLGYVLFYAPAYFFQHPFEIFAVWHGGMASHGGFIGVAVALLWVLRRRSRETILRIADIVVIPVTIGLGLGRIGNFINQELYGTVTTLPWAMAFPGADGLRHPIQLYDFFLQMLIALTLFWYLRRTEPDQRIGRVCALFLILYAVARFLLECIREQHGELIALGGLEFSKGQLLTIPIVIVGSWLWMKTKLPVGEGEQLKMTRGGG